MTAQEDVGTVGRDVHTHVSQSEVMLALASLASTEKERSINV
jgi:hypothetical protein